MRLKLLRVAQLVLEVVAVVVVCAWALDVRAAGFDFDEVMMVCMGFAGLAYVVVDQKRERTLQEKALEFEHRITKLEVQMSAQAQEETSDGGE